MQSLAGPSQEAADLYIGQSWSQASIQENVESDITIDNQVSSLNKNVSGSPGPSCSSENNTSSHSDNLKYFDIYKELTELYRELGETPSEYPDLHPQSFLLQKLVKRKNLNTMIIKLYPGNKGYSFVFKLPKGEESTDTYMGNPNTETERMFETKCWLYENDDLLKYIDNGELPTLIVEKIETYYSNLFYSNTVIAEIWDYRQSYANLVCDINYVLLRPSMQSIVVDVARLTSTGEWSSKDRLALEAELIKAAAPPLCLDPDPIHGEIAVTAQQTSHLFNTRSIKRKARKFSQIAINRKRKLNQYTQYHGPDLCSTVAFRQKSSPVNCKKYKQTNEIFMPGPSLDLPELSVPSSIGVFHFVQKDCPTLLAHEVLLNQMEGSQLVEEYIFNIYKKEGLVCIDNIKLSILQRMINLELFGELRVEYYQKDGVKNYRTCEFTLGTRAQATRFYDEFKEIVTDEGKECVQITHIEPGKQSVVTYTDALKRVAAQHKAVSPSNLQVPRPSQQLMDNALLNQSLLNSTRSNIDNAAVHPTTSPGPSVAGSNLISSLPGNTNFIINSTNTSDNSMSMNQLNNDVANTIVQNNNLVNNSVVYKNYIGVVPASSIPSDRQYSNITVNKPITMNVNQNNVSTSVPLLQAIRNQAIRPVVQEVVNVPSSGQSVLASNAIHQTQQRKPGDQVMEKLRNIHRELSQQQKIKNMNINIKDVSFLLQQLVTKEKLGTLIFSFHGSDKGFLISAISKNSSQTSSTGCDNMEKLDSVRWPYQESELLNILEKEEFAPILIKLTTQKYPHLIIDNCIIAEIRDYREAVPKYKYILLKPDMVKLQLIQRQKSLVHQQLAAVAAASAASAAANSATEIRKSPLTCQSTSPQAAISAIENDLQNSVQQYQERAAAAAAAAASLKASANASSTGSSSGNNATLISLLDSAPAAMTKTQQVLSQKARTGAIHPSRRMSLSPGGNVVVGDPGSSHAPAFTMRGRPGLLAADAATQQNTASVNAALLERHLANSSPSKKAQYRTPSPVQIQAGSGFNLQQYARMATQGGLLPVTVSASALAQTNSHGGGVGATVNPAATFARQTVLLNTAHAAGSSPLPMSLAQLVAAGVKGVNTQAIRSVPAGIVSFNQGGVPLQLLEALRRPAAPLQATAKPQLSRNAASKVQQITGTLFKMAVPSTATVSHASPAAMSSGNTILTLTPQQLEQNKEQPKATMNPAAMLFDAKHRRRSHTNDGS